MKTAISLPDDLFDAAEEAARSLGLTRSGLYSRALSAYLEKYGSEGIKERLDRVYRVAESRLDPALARWQSASLPEEDW